MNYWLETMTAQQLEAYYAEMAKLDPAFTATQKKFYETRSAAQLSSLAVQAWNVSNGEMYCLAKTYGKAA